MRAYTAHLKPGREPVLVREGFAWGALLFGPLWFAAHRAWVPAAVDLLLCVAALSVPFRGAGAVMLGLAVLAGLLGRDLVRWSLDRRGYTLASVVVARNEEVALGRLLTFHPEAAASLAALLR